MLLMWLGEQITERGIGNGISLVITIGILARFPRLCGPWRYVPRQAEALDVSIFSTPSP